MPSQPPYRPDARESPLPLPACPRCGYHGEYLYLWSWWLQTAPIGHKPWKLPVIQLELRCPNLKIAEQLAGCGHVWMAELWPETMEQLEAFDRWSRGEGEYATGLSSQADHEQSE